MNGKRAKEARYNPILSGIPLRENFVDLDSSGFLDGKSRSFQSESQEPPVFLFFGNHIPVKTQSNEEGDQGRGDYCPRDRFQPIHFAAPSSHFFGWIRVLDDSAFSQSYGVGIAVCADKPLIESTSSLLMPPKPPGSLWTGGYHRRRVKASVKVHVARGFLGTPPKKSPRQDRRAALIANWR